MRLVDIIDNVVKGGAFQIDPKALLIALKNKIIVVVILSMLVTLGAAVAAKKFIKNSWKARCVMIRHNKNMSVQPDLPYLYQQYDMNTAMEMIRTRENLLEVIRRVGLEDTEPDDLFGSISAGKGHRSNLMYITAIHEDRKTAVKMANTMAEVFIESLSNMQNSAAVKLHHYYIKQMEDTEENVKQLEEQARQFQEENNVVSVEDETGIKYRQIQELEIKQIENQMLITDLETKLADINENLDKIPERVVLRSSFRAVEVKKLSDLKKELQMMRQKYTDKNPKVLHLQKEIEVLEKSVSNEAEKEKSPDEQVFGINVMHQGLVIDRMNYQADLKSAQKNARQYESTISALKSSLNKLSDVQRSFFTLKRNLDLNKETLRIIERRLSEIKLAKESNVGDIEIVERAAPPRYPESAKRKVLAVGAGGLVFTLGLFLFLAMEILDFSIKTRNDFDAFLKIPMAGQIPERSVVSTQEFYAFFQVFFDALKDKISGASPAMAIFCSDRSGTGKSFIIDECLELVGAMPDKKCLLIRCADEIPSDYRDAVINDALYPGETPSLRFVHRDDAIDEGWFLCRDDLFKKVLSPEDVKGFLSTLKDYDYIFWESFDFSYNMPLLSVIASQAQATVIVCGARYSQKLDLKIGTDFLRARECDNMVGVLNRIKKQYLDTPYYSG